MSKTKTILNTQRKQEQPIQLLQLAVAIVFGYMTDFAVWVLSPLQCSGYAMAWLFCGIGIVLVAVGVSFEVTAHVVTLAGEGLVLAICQVAPVKFGTMKVLFDVTLVVIACILSFVLLHGLYGVREGTVAAALFVGTLSKQINKPLAKVGKRLFS
ncbi:MAG: hypothetical protein LIO70_09590 [Clostridiales bacterium]|nr:hypothetical protein [Clostridiales bacterium]